MQRGYIEFSIPISVPTAHTLPTLPKMRMPLFANNAAVCYKNHSLAPGGVGSVRNCRKKSLKT